MFPLLLLSIVIVPVVLGAVAARAGDARRGLLFLLACLLAYNTIYLVMLHYLRHRWVG